jgi:nucleolar protein 56
MPTVVTAWFGAYLVDGRTVLRSVPAPLDPISLAARARARREGRLTPEEERLLSERGAAEWTTRDRRLASAGVRWDPKTASAVDPPAGADDSVLRAALLADAEVALVGAWDPSIHVEEAVRAAADLDRVRNLIGERLGSWVARDAPELDPGDASAAANAALAGASAVTLGPVDPGLLDARRTLAELYRSIEAAHHALTEAVKTAVPTRTPNLNALLGPDLSARLLAQAGGLARLARLPASTIQVLGAERAFFEHLRRGTAPPRHGHLFLHPAIQSAPRSERGKLARALAGKVAIAARMDLAGAAVDPRLLRAFDARKTELRNRRTAPKGPRKDRRSGLPLHGAPDDR